eukprot:2477916-Pyramimonas_sp.AAC.1
MPRPWDLLARRLTFSCAKYGKLNAAGEIQFTDGDVAAIARSFDDVCDIRDAEREPRTFAKRLKARGNYCTTARAFNVRVMVDICDELELIVNDCDFNALLPRLHHVVNGRRRSDGARLAPAAPGAPGGPESNIVQLELQWADQMRAKDARICELTHK